MKRITCISLVLMLCFFCVSCMKSDTQYSNVDLEVSQMKSICELATMDCYYHNVAKYTKDDASGMWWWKKDRHFWVEYAGIISMGIDVSRVEIKVSDSHVTITIPPAEVFDCTVDMKTLNKDSFIVAKDSAKVEAEHQTEALKHAQANMKKSANNDKNLLATAQLHAQNLLSDYVTNIGKLTGKTYKIEWVYLDEAQQESTELQNPESQNTEAQ